MNQVSPNPVSEKDGENSRKIIQDGCGKSWATNFECLDIDILSRDTLDPLVTGLTRTFDIRTSKIFC